MPFEHQFLFPTKPPANAAARMDIVHLFRTFTVQDYHHHLDEYTSQGETATPTSLTAFVAVVFKDELAIETDKSYMYLSAVHHALGLGDP